MKYPKPYFSKLPCIGDLSIDYVFFEAECPILFTCQDAEENLYLCVCCDIRDEQRWIVSPITAKQVIKMINNEISLFDAFHSDNVYVITWQTGYEKEKIKKYSFNDIDLNDIPEQGEFLDAEDGEYNDYIEKLHHSLYITSSLPEIKLRETTNKRTMKCNFIFTPIIYEEDDYLCTNISKNLISV